MTFSTQFIEYFYIDLKALNIIDFKEMVDMVTPWLHNQFRRFHLMNISSYSYSAHFAHNTFKMINLLMTVILIFLGPFIYHPVGLIIILCTTQITYKRSFLLYNQSIFIDKNFSFFLIIIPLRLLSILLFTALLMCGTYSRKKTKINYMERYKR